MSVGRENISINQKKNKSPGIYKVDTSLHEVKLLFKGLQAIMTSGLRTGVGLAGRVARRTR